MKEDASISLRSAPEPLTILFPIIRDVRICKNLYHAVLQILIKRSWISFHCVVRLLFQKQSSLLFEILIISDSVEHQILMKRGQSEYFYYMTSNLFFFFF